MAVRPRVVVVGSGFAGLNAVRRLAKAPLDITVIDRDNYHGFWPLLYEVATAALGTDDIARPIRAVYKKFANVSVKVGTVSGVDFEGQSVEVDGEDRVHYDYLILAAGASTTDFGISGVAEHAFPLKTLPDAVRLRNHILTTFEKADSEARGGSTSPGIATIALVGGGPTGVEMAGALSELIAVNLASDFRHLDLTEARVVLIEMADRLLPSFAEVSSERALRTLEAKGVEVMLDTKLEKVTGGGVTFGDGSSLQARTVVWTAGVRANPLTDVLPGDKGKGRTLSVESDLRVPGRPNVFAVGDFAASAGRQGEQLPQLAQVAIQSGRHSADNILRLLSGRPTRPFHYRDKGIMATIGRHSAVAELPGGIRFGGTFGWFTWLAVHLLFLIGFRNRIVVLLNWAWNYITWDRAWRVILNDGFKTPTGQHRA